MSGYRPGAVLHVAPAILYVVAVFYLGSVSIDPLGDMTFAWKDKLLHALVFAGMQLSLARAMRFTWQRASVLDVAVRSTVAAILCGGALELWQAALPHRSAEWLDWLADGVGAALAGVFWWYRHEPDHAEKPSRVAR